MSIVNKTLNLLSELSKDRDLTHDLQTEIHPEIFFRRNSVNLLVGKKGSGKTYNVFREILKLREVPNHLYTKMIYVSDKPWDRTYDLVKNYIPLTVEKVPYNKAVEAIKEVAEAKNAAHEIVENSIEKDQLDDDALQHIESALGSSLDDKNEIYHTIVLLDDCQDRFVRRTPQNQELWRLLFENRQPKITYFLTMQDPKGIDSSLKENLDSAWLFGGFSDWKFKYLLRSIQNDFSPLELWEIYNELTKHQALVFDMKPEGTELCVLKE